MVRRRAAPPCYMLPQHAQFEFAAPQNALSFDVEDYFQVSAFEGVVRRDGWGGYEWRVERNTHVLLDLLGESGTRATFFTLGCVAARHPELVRRIAAEGHELASHGYDHRRVTELTREEFREDVVKTRQLLEDLSGVRVTGYRAPSYSIVSHNLWALDVLQETGHRYSSSVYPILHDLYGIPDAPRFAFRTRPGGLLEVPITTCRVGRLRVPCGGGGYFRLLPYRFFSWAIRRVNARDRQPAVFYLHPWEIDPGQPRIANAPRRSRLRHYTNLDATLPRLRRLLREFRWGRMDEVFATPVPAAVPIRPSTRPAVRPAVASSA